LGQEGIFGDAVSSPVSGRISKGRQILAGGFRKATRKPAPLHVSEDGIRISGY
jgi:hypothetical protein